MVECLTGDRRAAGSSLTGVTVLCPCARHIYPYLVLIVDWDVKNQIKQIYIMDHYTIQKRVVTTRQLPV